MLFAQAKSVMLPEAGSTFAGKVDELYYFIFWLSVFFFFLILIGLVFMVVKYRRRNMDAPVGGLHHSMALELTWTIIPTLLVLVIFAWGLEGYMDMRAVPEDSYEIKVSAQKWGWNFTYRVGGDTFSPLDGKLHVPSDRPVKLTMTSQDVIHSLFIPAFRAKMDIVPGRVTTMWFRPLPVDPGTLPIVEVEVEESKEVETIVDGKPVKTLVKQVVRKKVRAEGKEFPLYCAEYCGAAENAPLEVDSILGGTGFASGPDSNERTRFKGKGHSGMFEFVVVHPPGEFDGYLARALEDSMKDPVKLGESKWKGLCQGCHSITGVRMAGPSFKGIWDENHEMEGGRSVKVDAEYVRRSILEPLADVRKGFVPVMPSFKGQLTDKQIAGIVEYIRSLK